MTENENAHRHHPRVAQSRKRWNSGVRRLLFRSPYGTSVIPNRLRNSAKSLESVWPSLLKSKMETPSPKKVRKTAKSVDCDRPVANETNEGCYGTSVIPNTFRNSAKSPEFVWLSPLKSKMDAPRPKNVRSAAKSVEFTVRLPSASPKRR